MAQTMVDQVITDAVTGAIKRALQVQVSTQVEIVSICGADKAAAPEADIAAVLGLASEKLGGSIVACMPKATFLGLVNRMLGEQFTEISDEISDAAGEILNIIYGLARPVINSAGHAFMPAIPSVMRGSHIVLSHANAQSYTQIRCQSDVGPFHVELSVTPVGRAR